MIILQQYHIVALNLIPGLCVYDLHHTYASHMLSAGKQLKVAREALGRSSTGTMLDLCLKVMLELEVYAAEHVDATLKRAIKGRD